MLGNLNLIFQKLTTQMFFKRETYTVNMSNIPEDPRCIITANEKAKQRTAKIFTSENVCIDGLKPLCIRLANSISFMSHRIRSKMFHTEIQIQAPERHIDSERTFKA